MIEIAKTVRRILVVLSCFALLGIASLSWAEPIDVIIYYANETHLNDAARQNYQTLSEWIADEQTGQKIAKQIASDAKAFPQAVAEELQDILKARQGAHWLVFTNALSTSGKALMLKDGNWQSIDWQVPSFQNYISQSNPNSNAATFAAALDLAARQFDSSKHVFALVTKSHGSKQFLIVPRITLRSEDLTPEKVRDIVLGQNISNLPRAVGVTRKEYFDTIEAAGQSPGMAFRLVFTESCKGRLGIDELPSLPSNIQMLVSPSVNLEYKTLDYATAASADDPSKSIEEQLKSKFPTDIALAVQRGGGIQNWWWYWMPLVFLGMIYVVRKTV